MNTTNECFTPLTDAVVQLTGEDGNGWRCMSRIMRRLWPAQLYRADW